MTTTIIISVKGKLWPEIYWPVFHGKLEKVKIGQTFFCSTYKGIVELRLDEIKTVWVCSNVNKPHKKSKQKHWLDKE